MSNVTTLPKADAAWISKNVLTRTYLKSCGGVQLVRRCACEYGQCGHCGKGDHPNCATWIGHDGKPPAAPHTHLVGRSGGALVKVWTAGKPCRWVCSCESCGKNHPVKKAEAHRRVTGDPRPGDTVWLNPKTLGCPAVCWKQPRATVVSTSDSHLLYLLVEVDGQEHRIHVDNISRTDPGAEPRRRTRPVKHRKPLSQGYIEQSLF